MKFFSWIGLFCALALATGCGGSSVSGGESGAAGSDESGGSGGSGNVGGRGGSANGGTPGSGGSVAGSGGGVTAGSAGTCASIGAACCQSDFDCPVAGVCAQCQDGSFVCPTGRCSNGQCFSETPECPEGCGGDTDCGAPSCLMCADGTAACSNPTCIEGRCVTTPPICNDPCANLACGEPCTTADSGGGSGSGESAYMTCNANGICVYGASECGDGCDSPDDCALPEICIPCAGDSCAVGACQSGACTRVCPSGRQPCTTASDCPTPPPVCIECPGGSCQTPACIDNECRLACPTSSACMSDTDCLACTTCFVPQDNADVACYPSGCQNNLCHTSCN